MPFLSRVDFETTDFSLNWEVWEVLTYFVRELLILFLQKKWQNSSSLRADSDAFWPGIIQETNHVPFSVLVLEGQWTSSLQCISEMNKLYSKKVHMLKAGYIPSNLLVDQDVVRDLSSGACKYRDFIRQLPIHLSKYILSMLRCIGDFSRVFLL